MIEAYAFLAMFTVQIVVGSIVFPERVIRRVRRWVHESGSERFRQLYPESDFDQRIRWFVIAIRATNIAVAVVGFTLLGWFCTVVGHADWAYEVKRPLAVFIGVQFAPLVILALYATVRGLKLLTQPSQEPRRKAILQRRTMFDFVSPFAVWLAALSYIGFVAFAIYLDLYVYGNTKLSKNCLQAVGAVTFVYAVNAFVIYKYLYGRKNPFVSPDGRSHSIGVNVKGSVYSSIAAAWFFSLVGVVGQPHLEEWQPFALSVFVVFSSAIGVMGMSAPSRKPNANEISSTEVTS